MSMDYGSNYADVVSKSFIKRLCPKQFKRFMDSLYLAKWELENWAEYVRDECDLNLPNNFDKDEDFQNWIKSTKKCWKDLLLAFSKATKVGMSSLRLYIDYHSSDDGSRYDEVEGAFFAVDQAYELTPAGKKFQKAIERKLFVTFG